MERVGGGKDITRSIDCNEMMDKKIDCYYEKTEKVVSDKLENGSSIFHTFSTLQDRDEKFGIWGFGLLDALLGGNKEKDRPPIASGTPVRFVYRGKKLADIKFKNEKGKTVEARRETHQIDLFVIAEEVKSKKILETQELVYAR